MIITAEYVDTCLPCYLQDGHNREGETLLCAFLGMDLDDTVETMIIGMDTDCGIPSWVGDEPIAQAIVDALEGVDLRWIDMHGNRCRTPDTDAADGDEPMVYVVLRWEHDGPAYFDRWDVCEAYQLLAHDYGLYDVQTRLDRIRFRAARSAEFYSGLSDNGRAIYDFHAASDCAQIRSQYKTSKGGS